MRAAIVAGLAALLPLAACWSETGVPGECRIDRDCNDDTVCSRVGSCESSSDLYALRIEWTVHGLTTDQAGACNGISELEIGVTDPSTTRRHRVSPVPCAAGSFFYDKLPIGYTEVEVWAYDDFGGTLDVARASAVGQGGVVRVSLLP
jgi:hypothetical protein